MQQLSLSDGRNRPNRLENGRRHFAVNANERDSISATLRLAPTESKRSDINAESSQGRADLADDSGLVAVSQIENRAFKLRLQRNSFDMQHTRRAVVEDRAFCCETWCRPGSFGQSGDFK